MAAKKKTRFIDYFQEWIETFKVGAIQDITLDKYWMTYNWVEKLMPNVYLEDLDRKTYQGMLNEYAKTHAKQTTADFHIQVSSAIRDAYNDGLINRNPAYKPIIKGIEVKKRKKFLEMDQLRDLLVLWKPKLLSEEPSKEWFLTIIAKTGLRFAEALALTPEDFDLSNQLLRVNKTWDYKISVGKFSPTKNESSIRKIKLDWQLVAQLPILLKDKKPGKPIFISGRVFNSTFNNFLKISCQKANVPSITIHGLRHTHGSVLLTQGISIQSISKRLGHANTITTQKVYLHLLKEMEEKDNMKIMNALSTL